MIRTAWLVGTVALATASVASATVLDFSTGTAGPGGTVIDLGGGNFAGSGIRIDALTVDGTSFDGVYNVDGSIGCATGAGGSCGSLDFNTAANTISITGSVPGLSIPTVTLLSGSFTSFSLSTGSGIAFFLASGPDTKDPRLLAALGIDPSTEFTYFGFETSIDSGAPGCPASAPCRAISTDIVNTSVPEPGTMLLLGSGISALALRRRRKA